MEYASTLNRILRFAGKFLLAVSIAVGTLWLIGVSFRFSRWAGFLALAIVGVVLYRTAGRWVQWLPGLLVFGILNSLLALVTQHAPTNPRVEASPWVSFLFLAYFAVGSVVSYSYDAAHLSVFDRLALLAYLFCMIWPAAGVKSLAVITPVLAWSLGIGMTVLIASFLSHRILRDRKVAS